MPFSAASLAELLIRSRAEYIELQNLITNNANANPQIWQEKCHKNLDFIKQFIEENGWPSSSSLEQNEITNLRTILLEKYGWQDCNSFSDDEIAKLVEYSAWMSVQHGDANNMELAQIIGNSGTITITELEKTRANLLQQQQEIISKQEFCLAKMQEENAAPHHIAFVTDRIKRNKGEAQIYNTQFQAHPLYPHKITEIYNPETIETRRTEMNLDSNEIHMQNRDSVFNGDESPIILMPPIIRNNEAIRSFKEFQTKASLEYNLTEAEQDPNLHNQKHHSAKSPGNLSKTERREDYDKLLTEIDSLPLSQAKVAGDSIKKEEGKEQNHDTKWQEKVTTTEKIISPDFN